MRFAQNRVRARFHFDGCNFRCSALLSGPGASASTRCTEPRNQVILIRCVREDNTRWILRLTAAFCLKTPLMLAVWLKSLTFGLVAAMYGYRARWRSVLRWSLVRMGRQKRTAVRWHSPGVCVCTCHVSRYQAKVLQICRHIRAKAICW